MKKISVILFFLVCYTQLNAQSIRYSVFFDTTFIYVGEQIHFNIELRVPRDVSVKFPVFKNSIVEGIEVISQPLVDSTISGEVKIFQHRTLITSFDSGAIKIDSLPLELMDSEGQKVIFFSKQVVLNVGHFPVNLNAPIRDIKGILGLSRSYWSFILWGLVVLLALTVAILLYRRYLKKISSGGTADGSSFLYKLSPQEEIYKRLKQIEKRQRWTNTKSAKVYHSELSEIVKHFLGRVYEIHILEMTTNETLSVLKELDMPDEDALLLKKMLNFGDMVKFAKTPTTIEKNKECLLLAFKFADRVINIVSKSEKENNLNKTSTK